jgi:DNA-binding SARP family transcriptional activator/Tfp pilus assembly protein PilF
MFRLLGGVELQVGATYISAGPPQRCRVLAALLIDAGRVVPVETLVDRIWADDPPDKATRTLHTHLSRIRRLIESTGMPATVVRVAAGYRIDVDPVEVDLHRFRALVSEAAGRDDAERAQRLGTALALWRGEPLAGLGGGWAEAVRQAWRTRHLEAAVAWGEALLRLGDAAEAITELGALVEAYPLAEQLVITLMRLLHAAGRDAEALVQYAAARSRLAEELGTEPGAELRRVHRAVLRGQETELSAEGVRDSVTAVRRPALLPPDLPGFVGRDRELAHLDTLLAANGNPAGAVLIVAVCGMPGVGKTSLAVHWAHRVRGQFPDGQLYLNLRGFDPSGATMTPAEAVNRLLYALGVPAHRIPAPVDAQLDLFRTELAGRRLILVLDNARDAEQIRPLLPGEPRCLVVSTSRHELLGLVAAQGAQSVVLDPLTETGAQQLLARRLGDARTTAEPAAVREVVERCGRLPLALAVTAARVATRPALSLTAVAAELRDARGGLDAFDGSDPATDLRAVFSWSYHLLSDAAAAMFRLLALHPGPEIPTAAAASLAGLPVAYARRQLAELAGVHLTVEHRTDRYVLHDLVRAYAAEQLTAREDDTARQQALLRMFDHYVHTAHAAAMLLDPHRRGITLAAPVTGVTPEPLADHAAALDWFDTEHTVLMVVVERAWSTRADSHVTQLAWGLTDFLQRRGHWHDQAAVQRTAVAAACRVGDRPRQANSHRLLGLAYAWLGCYDEAHAEYAAALRLFTDLADPIGQAHTHRGLAWTWEQQQLPAEALRHAQRAFTLFRAAGEQRAEARALNMIGWYHVELGDAHRARDCCQEALLILQRLGDVYGQAATLDSLGYIRHRLGHHRQAADCYRHALELLAKLGDRCEEANTLVRLGDTYQAGGAPVDADRAYRQALEIFEQLDHSMAAEVRLRLTQPATIGST